MLQVNDLYDNAKPLFKWVSKSSETRENPSNEKSNVTKKNVPTATVAPSRRQIPSIIIIPGTPKVPIKTNAAPQITVDEDTSKAIKEDETIVDLQQNSVPEIVLNDEADDAKIIEPGLIFFSFFPKSYLKLNLFA